MSRARSTRFVAASINLLLASELADGNRELRERFSEASAEIEEGLAELREVAHGLYPPALRRLGLVRALGMLATRHPGSVVLTESSAQRFSPEVEAAIYYTDEEIETIVWPDDADLAPDTHWERPSIWLDQEVAA